jgi:stearoyl-CoA desaturase (delta-9 desaturase)
MLVVVPLILSPASHLKAQRPPAVLPTEPELLLVNRRTERVSVAVYIANTVTVVLPLVAFVVAVVLSWKHAATPIHLAVLVAFYVLTTLGVTIGFHRYFTHKSFETPRFIQIFLAIAGSMAVEGPLTTWVATHRRHHQHSDTDDDPHSPHGHGYGVMGVLKGFWHAHVGWFFRADAPGLARYVVDLSRQRVWRTISRLFPLWVAIGLLVPAVIGGLVTMSWTGALLGFLWGGLARVFLVHHVTWSINSIGHLWGSKPYRSHDESRNNFVLGVLAMGEGWHNNHHAFPTSARHGLAWWQIDVSYYLIRAMEVIGLAWKVRVPTVEQLDAKRVG